MRMKVGKEIEDNIERENVQGIAFALFQSIYVCVVVSEIETEVEVD